jgi:hypothetical protein
MECVIHVSNQYQSSIKNRNIPKNRLLSLIRNLALSGTWMVQNRNRISMVWRVAS